MSRDRLAAVVLAAGASTRMGRPKALVPWRGRPFVAHAIALAERAGARPIAVVQGAIALPADAIVGAERVENPRWPEGPLTSLQAGLARALGEPIDAVLVVTIDRPHIAATTIDALVAAWRGAPDRVWQPSFEGVHGHPIVWPVDLARRLAALEPPSTARDLAHASDVMLRRSYLPVEDPAVIENLDRPEDLARLPA